MKTKLRLGSARMGREIDQKTRLRMAANLRVLLHEHKFKSIAAMAKEIGVSRGALSHYVNGERTMGLDVALLIHRKLGVSLDWLVDREPDPEWYDPDHIPAVDKKLRQRKTQKS